MRLMIPGDVMQQIRRHGEATYPQECCGFMLGSVTADAHQVARIREQPNERADSKENRFLITPQQFMRAEKYARQEGLTMLGIYHSHPDCPARPSDYDRDHAWPFYSYLIVSVKKGVAGEAHTFQLKEDRSGFVPGDLEVEEKAK